MSESKIFNDAWKEFENRLIGDAECGDAVRRSMRAAFAVGVSVGFNECASINDIEDDSDREIRFFCAVDDMTQLMESVHKPLDS